MFDVSSPISSFNDDPESPGASCYVLVEVLVDHGGRGFHNVFCLYL